MARRHLPVIASTPAASPSPPESTESTNEPPPWHWIPLGSTVSVVTFALLAPGALAIGTRVLGHFYGRPTNPQAMLALRAMHPGVAMLHESVVGLVVLFTLCASIGLGGYVIGRYGPVTNARHGTLSGMCTAALFCAITRMLPMMVLCIPLGMLAGYGSARIGVYIRDRVE